MIRRFIKSGFHKLGYEIQTLNRRNTEKNISESVYFKGQSNGLDYFETPIGNYYLPNDAPNDIVINSMKNGIYFEREIIRIAEQYIKTNTVVLDVGSNFGQMSIYFSKLTGSNGKVYAFEADDYIFEVLSKNIEANKCNNIQPVFGAVYDVEDKIFHFPKQDFVKYGAYGSYGLAPKSDTGREVKSLTIDSLCIEEPVSFMKIDIQGSDLFALKGAENTIKKNKMPIIFEFEQQFQQDFNTTFQDYVEFVDHISYKFAEIVNDINYVILPR
jgi:FkbM family methyltransferase